MGLQVSKLASMREGPELYTVVGAVSAGVGHLFYGLSSSFNHLFGEWTWWKMLLFGLWSLIILAALSYAGKWRLQGRRFHWPAHLTAVVLTVTAVYSFFYDKTNPGKPDAFAVMSCLALCFTLFSLSMLIQLEFVMDLLYFYLGLLIILLMKIKLLFVVVGVGFSYSVVVFRSALDPQPGSLNPILRNINLAYQLGIGGSFIFNLLTDCANALQQNNSNAADTILILNKLESMAASQTGGAIRKVGPYFAQALARRISVPQQAMDSFSSHELYMGFYESFPYLKFAYHTANQAIVKAFTLADKVHVIDLGLKQVRQWSFLMGSLGLEEGRQLSFRLTGISLRQRYHADHMKEEIQTLKDQAEALGITFEFCPLIYNSLEELDPVKLKIESGETLAVNSVFELHRLLAKPGAIEKVLKTIETIKPKIMTIVEQEANHNGSSLVDRLTEAFPYYLNVFESLPELAPSQDLTKSEFYLMREICNVIGCGGSDRVERHEMFHQWEKRMVSAGFNLVHFDSNNLEGAMTFCRDNYKVEDNSGCLVFGSHSRPHIVTSAWTVERDVLPLSGQFRRFRPFASF